MDNVHKKREVGLNCLTKARNYVKLKNWARAFPHYLMCLELFETERSKFEQEFSKVLYRLGIWLYKNNKLTDICKWYTKGLEYFPSNPNILNNFAKHLLRIEEPETALLYLELAHTLDPNSLTIENNLTTAKLDIIPRWHYRMLNDHKRNGAFKEAITKAVTPKDKILDLGSGCGLLSFYATTRNCTAVAVESSSTLCAISQNALSNVKVINKHSSTLSVADIGLRNVLITEIFDTALFGEHILESLIHAWDNLLEPCAKVIPHAADLFITGFNSSSILQHHKLNTSIPFIQLTDVCVTLRINEPYEAENLKFNQVTYLTNVHKVCTVRFDDVAQLKNLYGNIDAIPIFVLKCLKSGTVTGFAIWFNLHLDDVVVITTNPMEDNVTCWGQAIIDLDHPITLGKGDEIKVQVSCVDNVLKVVVLEPMTCTHCFKVSADVITYLNDPLIIDACRNFSAPILKNDLCVLDLNPFPLFALCLAKRIPGRYKYVLNDLDWEFFNYVFRCNGVSDLFERCNKQTGPYDLVFTNPVLKNGTLDEYMFQRMPKLRNALKSDGCIFPSALRLHLEVIESDYLIRCYKVDDANLLGLVVADEMNKYSVLEHWEIEPKHFKYRTLGCVDVTSFDLLNCDLETNVRVNITSSGNAHGVLYWFTMDYSSQQLNTFNSLHYKSACFIFTSSKLVHSDDKLTLTVRKDNGFLKIYCKDCQI